MMTTSENYYEKSETVTGTFKFHTIFVFRTTMTILTTSSMCNIMIKRLTKPRRDGRRLKNKIIEPLGPVV